MIRGPSASRRIRLSQQQRPFFLGKAAFRADQDVDSGGGGRPGPAGSDGMSSSAASSQKISGPAGVALAEIIAPAFSGSATVATLRMPHCSAASTTLARIRSVLTRKSCVNRVSDRLKRRGAHLDGLLDHVVEPGMFQRRET